MMERMSILPPIFLIHIFVPIKYFLFLQYIKITIISIISFNLSILKQNYNIAKKCSGDIITILPYNEKDGTEDIRIRVIEVILNDGTKEYLATNLFDSHISQQMFRELYFYRWPVETKYKEILCNLFDLSALDILYKESLRCRSQIMPGRTFRRKKNKAIGRTHFNNKKVAF